MARQPIRPRNRIAGRLIDSLGSPLPRVVLSLVGAARTGRPLLAWTSDRGDFQFGSIPAGEYRLVANPISTGETLVPRVYYPHGATRASAEVLTVEARTIRGEIVFQLPALGRRTEVEVEARTPDGQLIEFSATYELLRRGDTPLSTAAAGACMVPTPRYGPRFPLRVTVFENEAACLDSQAADGMTFGSRTFIPSGLISPSGEPVSPPESHALITGHVLEASEQRNSVTGAPFWWALVDTEGGTYDVVIDPELLSAPVQPGNVLSGWFWLSGRLRSGDDARAARGGWFKRLTGRG